LVHGTVSDHTRWENVIPIFAKYFTVYAIDRRGRGSSTDNTEYSIHKEFDDILALVRSIDEPVFLVGHSFGAYCSLESAIIGSGISKLVLYEPPAPGKSENIPEKALSKMQSLLDAGKAEEAVTFFLLDVGRITPDELKIIKQSPTWERRKAAAHTIIREMNGLKSLPEFDFEKLNSFHTPTLLLLGGESSAVYKDFTESLHKSISNSVLSVLPGQKHVAMSTSPELFASEVINFLLSDQ
jgi:pimeloyl-ACP methyl ester carboxylesterase